MYFCSVYSAEEKKPVKRSYQKIQEDEDDEDDDYRSHISPRNIGSTATQLVGCQSFTSLMAQNAKKKKSSLEIHALIPHPFLSYPKIPAGMSATRPLELIAAIRDCL